LLVISAGQHITQGEELTINYKDFTELAVSGYSYESRRAYILSTWKFTCTCRACTDPHIAAKLVRIQELEVEMANLWGCGAEREAYEVGLGMISLYDELGDGVGAWQRLRTWYEMFNLAVTREAGLSQARVCIQKCLENWLILVGGSNPEAASIVRTRGLVDNMQGFWRYLLLGDMPWELKEVKEELKEAN
jgi:hypothetical protein